MNRLARQLALILGTGLAGSAAADCGDDPSNLLQGANCDFDTDIAGWGSNGITSHDASRSTPDDGADPGTGSLQLTAGELFTVVGTPSSCFEAGGMAGQMLNFGGWFFLQSGSEFSCSLTLSDYGTNSSCEGPIASTVSLVATPVLETWTLSPGSHSVSTDPAFLRLSFSCDGSLMEFNADNFFISPTSTVPVELQSFEVD